MDIRKLQRAIVDGLEDVKAQDIVVFNTEHLSPLFERVIVASGSSNRQTKALAASVRNAVRAAGEQVLATEGEDNGEWIIVDCAAAVVHVMQPAIREYYRLEELWGGKPVRLKVGVSSGGLVKASEPDDEPPVRAKAKGKAKVMAQPARPGVAKKAVAAKPAPARQAAVAKTPTRQSPARKTALSKAAFTRAAPGKAAATKPAVKPAAKTAAKPTATKKAAPRVAAIKTMVVKRATKPMPKNAPKAAAKTASRSAARPAARPAAGRAPAKKVAAKKTSRRAAPRG